MFNLLKRKKKAKYYFIAKTDWIDTLILKLQDYLDENCEVGEEILLKYEQRYNFPKRYYKIEIPFSNDTPITTQEQFEIVSAELFDLFKDLDFIEIVCTKLLDSTKFDVDEISISYVLTNCCSKNKLPGILIFWKR